MMRIGLKAVVKAFAEEVGAVLWEGIPQGGSEVVWPDADAKSFLDAVRPLAPAVVYMSPDGGVISVAIAGVIHVFDPDGQRLGNDPDDVGPRLSLHDDDVEEDEELPPALQDLARRIAEDERFDGYFDRVSEDLIDESGLDVDPGLYQQIHWTAAQIFEEGIGGRLEKESRGLVRALIKHPDFDPLMLDFRDDEAHPYINDAVAGRDPRLRRMVQHGLQSAAWDQGLRDKAEREVKAEATRLRGTIPKLVLDQLGFTSRKATWIVLLAPFLGSVEEKRHGLTAEWIKRLEGDRAQATREVRFAAAAQRLCVEIATKTAVAAQLRLSTSTLNRLLGIRVPSDFEFEPDDPIVVELAPELRS